MDESSGRTGGSGALQRIESVQLFIARAEAISPEFQLTAENGAWVAGICRDLDGMPLAIELAAARVRSLSVQQIAHKLDERFRLLTGGSRTAPLDTANIRGNHRLELCFAFACGTKGAADLSVFAGGATLEAMEFVCAGDGVDKSDVLNLTSQLVNKSLVLTSQTSSEVRVRLLETIRQYASLKIDRGCGYGRIQKPPLGLFFAVGEECGAPLEWSRPGAVVAAF